MPQKPARIALADMKRGKGRKGQGAERGEEGRGDSAAASNESRSSDGEVHVAGTPSG